MTRKLLLIFVGITLHAFLTIWSFGVLFGIGHMHPDDRPLVYERFCSIVMATTWLPTLGLFSRLEMDGDRLIDSHPYPFVFTNSTIAVGGSVWIMTMINRRRNRHKKT
jgi:hypothetical protein